MAIRVFSIGRKPSSDIVFDDDSVSRLHAEVVVTRDGRLYVTDCGSTSGTAVWRQGRWQALRQGFVAGDERLRFGRCEMSAAELGLRLSKDENATTRFIASDVVSGEAGNRGHSKVVTGKGITDE